MRKSNFLIRISALRSGRAMLPDFVAARGFLRHESATEMVPDQMSRYSGALQCAIVWNDA